MDALLLSEYLYKVRLLVNKKYESSKANLEMSLAEVKLLMLLYRSKNYSLQTLAMAEYNKVTLAAIMHKLKDLEAKGYVLKENSVNDQRAKVYTLTAKGIEFADGIKERIDKYNKSLLASFSDSEAKALEDILKKIISFMENN